MKRVCIWCNEIKIVQGYTRSIIIDPQRAQFILVPKNFSNLISRVVGNSIEELEMLLSEEEFDWVAKCLEMEFLLQTPDIFKENFNEVSLEWTHPSYITNAVVHYSDDFEPIIAFLKKLLCRHVHILFEKESDLIDFLDTQIANSDFRSIEVTLENSPFEINVEDYYKKYPVLRRIFLGDENDRGTDSSFLPVFGNNLDIFNESQKHNVYFNRKIYIDRNGEIRRSVECGEDSFGRFDEIEIQDLLLNREFRKYWNVHKGKVDVCRDCEFRNICVDNRRPIQRNEEEWFYKEECEYNPFIAKWRGDKGYKTLSDCNVISDSREYIVNEEVLTIYNQELWEVEAV
ncbi:MAG: hypothetical protein MI810_03295 [Flavobacteriales bacterium]|nr:hypothetical protein [Flavobacteriales bacterium]